MTPLEWRYRRALRLLPGWYRRLWEDDMVATFLAGYSTDPADESTDEAIDEMAFGDQNARPSWSELASVAALALRLRLGLGTGSARSIAWEAAVRLAVLVNLAVNAASATAFAGLVWWQSRQQLELPAPLHEPTRLSEIRDLVGRYAPLLWVVAFLALLFGRRIAAQLVALAEVLLALAALVVARTQSESGWQPVSLLFLFFQAVTIAAIGAFPRHSSDVARPRWWLAGYAGGVGLMATLIWLTVAQLNRGVLLPVDWIGFYCLVLVTVTVAYLIRVRSKPRPLAWPLALCLLAGEALALRAVSLVDLIRVMANPLPPDLEASITLMRTYDVVEAMALLVAGISVAVLTARRLTQLPNEPSIAG